MTLKLPAVDRRTLLIGGGAGVGLVVAYLAWPRSAPRALAAGEGEGAFGHYIRIGRDGRVTVAVPQAEVGQGIWTALPQIVADELGAAWETVGVEPAPLAPVYANALAGDEGWLDGFGTLRRWEIQQEGAARITARSSSVRAFELPLRQAGALARAMLIRAAARRWAVSPGECDTVAGAVTWRNRRVEFGEVAEEAAELTPPDDAPLRPPGRGALVGQSLPRLDLPAKSDGSFRFAGDVRLPDMLYAAARLAPPGGRILGFSRDSAARAGAKQIVVTDGWLAAVAETSWAAERSLKAAAVQYQGESGDADLRQRCQDLLDSGELERRIGRGDYDEAVEGSRALTATYWIAPALHGGLEPLTATARPRGDRVEVWAGTQAPEFARRSLGTSPAPILYAMPAGDSGGRALEAEAAPIAAALASRIGRPVQVTLSATASRNQDRPAPPFLIRLKALPAGSSAPLAWKAEIATADGFGAAIARLGRGAAPLGTGNLAAALPPYAMGNVALESVNVPLTFAAGYVRGYPESALTFAIESFVDELARTMGSEPLAYRMGMLSGSPRLARCLTTAAALGGWDAGGPGSTLGLACASAYGSHIALLAEASVGTDQRLAVHRLVAAVDCGRMTNVGLVRQQVESGLLWALGQATAATPEFAGGMAISRPLGLPTIRGTPDIRVELIASGADPGGLSGLPAAVLAPALANAVAAGSGLRMRSLPFDPASA
ncbi:MAG TPA: molybdopterin cofactor-binding domain-containing protein [Sphingomicrobium sp.]|nr:molybdopterin cofactor-binding domain-containing protein [Sphingomicrobium sp.]